MRRGKKGSRKNGATGRSDIEGKTVRVTASDRGSERVSIKKFATASSSLDGGSGSQGAGQMTGISDPGYGHERPA
jgi:hypothetical protein